jgi:hypothetical protein
MTEAIRHEAVMIDRPQLPDGRYLVRGGTGMYPTSKGIGPTLSLKICPICGYGLTEQDMRKPPPWSDDSGPHTAIPLVVLEARRIAQYISRRNAA